MPVKVGDKYPTWFSDNEEGLSLVLDIKPYTGKYKEFYTSVLVLSAPRTRKGSLEMAVK